MTLPSVDQDRPPAAFQQIVEALALPLGLLPAQALAPEPAGGLLGLLAVGDVAQRASQAGWPLHSSSTTRISATRPPWRSSSTVSPEATGKPKWSTDDVVPLLVEDGPEAGLA